MKFGSTGESTMTWAMNTLLPGLVARRFGGPDRRIVALSTGNVYALVVRAAGGAVETDTPDSRRRIRSVMPGTRALVRVRCGSL